MSLIKARGIVLREIFVGESDKIVTILAKDYGKINIRARGARKSKSKFLAGTQLFTYSDFIISTKGNFFYLSEVETIEFFYDIRKDYDKLCYGNYFLELVDKSIMEDLETNNILLLLLKTLKVICSDKINLGLASSIFELKFLEYSGYRPQIEECNLCGKSIDKPNTYFGQEGMVCNNCNLPNNKYIKLNETIMYTLSFILSSELPSLYSFNLDSKCQEELKQICKLLMHNIDVKLNSKSFIGM